MRFSMGTRKRICGGRSSLFSRMGPLRRLTEVRSRLRWREVQQRCAISEGGRKRAANGREYLGTGRGPVFLRNEANRVGGVTASVKVGESVWRCDAILRN